MVLNGTIGARLHIAFPILNRSSFGFWFSYFSVISRVVLSLFWFGIQTFVGSECVYQVRLLFLPSFCRHLTITLSDAKSHLAIHRSTPESSSSQCAYNHFWCASTTRSYQNAKLTLTYPEGMICYFLYWLIQFPFMLVSPQKIRWLFFAKAIIVPPTWLAMLIWALVRVPPHSGILAQKAVLGGSELSWAWFSALNSALGNYATLGVNIPDFTVGRRYQTVSHLLMCGISNPEICQDRESVRKQEIDPFNDTNRYSHRQYIQLIIIPVGFTIASFIGIAVTSAGIALYGQVLWDPLKLIDHWDNRAAAFFASFAFTLGTLGTNISANSLSAGNDMTALWPRYINIRRGQVICAFLGGWVLCPWEILARCVCLR